MSDLKAISGNEIREDIDYNTRGIDPENKEWCNYGKELCDTLYYLKSEADKVIAEKNKEIAELKDQYKDMDVTHTVHIAKMNAKLEEQESDIVEKDTEIRRLKRALYKACSNWARSERYTEATWHGDEHREELWAEVQDKCRAKAEEY